jgi:hypothetical protein
MSHKKILLIITLLIAGVSIAFWSSDSAANKAAADPLQQNTPLVSFDRASINVVEPDAGETETITLNVAITTAPQRGEKVQVTARSANGNAIAGADYQPVSEYLTFPAGSTGSQSFHVAIFGNNLDQPDRAFVVYLTNPVNATVGIPAFITIVILDNDLPMPAAAARNFLPIIRGFVAGPTRTPMPPTATPCYGYC